MVKYDLLCAVDHNVNMQISKFAWWLRTRRHHYKTNVHPQKNLSATVHRFRNEKSIHNVRIIKTLWLNWNFRCLVFCVYYFYTFFLLVALYVLYGCSVCSVCVCWESMKGPSQRQARRLALIYIIISFSCIFAFCPDEMFRVCVACYGRNSPNIRET